MSTTWGVFLLVRALRSRSPDISLLGKSPLLLRSEHLLRLRLPDGIDQIKLAIAF